jgi:predicted RNA-binding Zn ribbon-like protein
MTPTTEGELPEGEELEAFNGLLGRASANLEIGSGDGTVNGAVARWRWRVSGDASGERILWKVARSAAKLLTSDEARAIRVCPGENCGWVFVDRSRNGLRRWCQMKTCGTRAKNRRRAAR